VASVERKIAPTTARNSGADGLVSEAPERVVMARWRLLPIQR
jgi:hypothetical protein